MYNSCAAATLLQHNQLARSEAVTVEPAVDIVMRQPSKGGIAEQMLFGTNSWGDAETQPCRLRTIFVQTYHGSSLSRELRVTPYVTTQRVVSY